MTWMLAADQGATDTPAVQWSAGKLRATRESLALEEPLAIEITYRRGATEVRRLVATTMRTPGADEDLACGFLFAEGLIADRGDVDHFHTGDRSSRGEAIVTVTAALRVPPRESLERVSRSLLTSSACGFCGRPSLESVRPAAADLAASGQRWNPAVLIGLPMALRTQQPLFAATGGSHGAALAAIDGTLVLVREDVGRHNAVDKVIGAALAQPAFAFGGHALVLSGRASFELTQKAAAAGLPVVVAVGAPSSLAVRWAADSGLTLIGFTREGRFNAYAGAARISSDGTP
ncbi:MAG TPA: formate dehydrogenase accessory sulfurtransferase FdhD [Opitutaceae bacterium]|jgi:FdhD protein